MMQFTISPGEADWWELDGAEFLDNEGAVTIASVSVASVTGTVTIGAGIGHESQIRGSSVFLWADATASKAGATTDVDVVLHLSNGSPIPRRVRFYTRYQ